MLHTLMRLLPQSMRLVPYQRDDHAVQVEEKHDQMKAELDKRFLFVDVQFTEYLCCVQEVLVIEDPIGCTR